MVCHDLRSPLNTVQLFHEMLAKNHFGELSSSGNALLKSAQTCTDNLLNMTNDMLESEKLEHTGVELIMSHVKLDTIIENAIDSTFGAVNPKQIALVYSPTEVEVVCDEVRILRVLSNLLGNAAKFSTEKRRALRSELTFSIRWCASP